MNRKSAFLGTAAGMWAAGALAADVEVINPDSYFPEGPLWHDGQLFEGARVLVADPEAQPVRILEVPAPYVTNLTFGQTEDVVFVTAATDAWEAPYPGQVFRVANR